MEVLDFSTSLLLSITILHCCFGAKGDNKTSAFRWQSDAIVQVLSYKVLTSDEDHVEEVLHDKSKINSNRNNKLNGHMIHPFEALRQNHKKPNETTHLWFNDYPTKPVDWIILVLIMIPVMFVRVLKLSKEYFRPVARVSNRREGTFPMIPLATIQQSPQEKAVQYTSRRGLFWLGKKFVIELQNPAIVLNDVYWKDEERTPAPTPWKVVQSLAIWMKQYAHMRREDASMMAIANVYADKIGQSLKEKNEIRHTVYLHLKEIERSVPYSRSARLKHAQNVSSRYYMREQSKKERAQLREEKEKMEATQAKESSSLIVQEIPSKSTSFRVTDGVDSDLPSLAHFVAKRDGRNTSSRLDKAFNKLKTEDHMTDEYDTSYQTDED